MKQRQVLITGAGGFVGKSLARGFVDLGWRVIGLDRAFDTSTEDAGIRRVVIEVGEHLPDEVPAVDLVVHAAWLTTDPETLKLTRAEYSAANLLPLTAVLRYALLVQPAALVFLSSSGIFAPDDARVGLTDVDRATGMSPYAVAKRAGERMMTCCVDEEATAPHVVRLGYLCGPGEAMRASRKAVSLVAGWIAAAREGRPLEVRSDDPARDWTFTSDLAPALERLVDGPPAGRPVHLASPYVYRDSQFAALIADEFPGAEVVTVSADAPVKPPMVPSDIPALRDFQWTDAASGVHALLADGSPA